MEQTLVPVLRRGSYHRQLGDAFKAFSSSLYAPLLVGIGAFLIMFSKKAKKQTVGEILVGLGLLFIGLDFMGDAAEITWHLPIFTVAFEPFWQQSDPAS